MWPFRTILYFLLFWVGCFAALVNPIWGVINYTMAYQLNPPITWWGTPLVNIGMRFSMLAVGFTALGLLTGRRRVPVTKPGMSLWEWGVISLVVIAILNVAIGTAYGPTAQYAFEKFWKLQVFVLILARLATTRRNLMLVFGSLVVGSAYLGYDAYTAPYRSFLQGRLEAFGGPDISTSSGAGAHLTAMLPIIGIVFLSARKWVWKIPVAIAGALTVNAIVLCRTRSAFIGLLAGLIVAVFLAPRARRFRVHCLLAIGLLCAASLTDQNYWARMSTLADREGLKKDGAAMARLSIFHAATQMLSDHPTGVGLGNFSQMVGRYDETLRYRSPHNTVIMAFCELGILGGIVFLLVCAESIRLLIRCSRLAHLSEDPVQTKFIVYGLLISLVSYFASGLGTERFSCESFWWVLAFPVCLHRLVETEVAARGAVATVRPSEMELEMPVLAYGACYGV